MMSPFLNSSCYCNGGDGDQASSSSYSNGGDGDQTSSYDVFLSFRGDTRHGFTDHLYKRLDHLGISVFRDKEGLPVGESNGPELVKAIEASKISVLIISPNYARSEWCLNELVHILKCKKTYNQLVMPIYYRIKPSGIRKQSGNLEKIHLKKKPDLDKLLVKEWKDALMEVSKLTGFVSEKIADGYEGELVAKVEAEILKALTKHTLTVSDRLVGVENHVGNIMKMINGEGCDDNGAILIHGMGGIGKTTLAKVVYNQLSSQFKHCSYLASISDVSTQIKGMEGLQRRLISDILGENRAHDISSVERGVNIIREGLKRKKVLLLLDDVDDGDQLDALVGKGTWFGRGSMVIITSRNKDILDKWEGGSFPYELNVLNASQSLELFYKHALKIGSLIPDEYHTIAKEIVSTTGGLPLAIEVIGSMLLGKSIDYWKDIWERLKTIPAVDVLDRLKLSYKALRWEEQQLFLDVSCHSITHKKDIEMAFHMWEACSFHPRSGINRLMSLSLIKKGENGNILIHDLLRDLGRLIVREESLWAIGRYSRLWKSEEAFEVLNHCMVQILLFPFSNMAMICRLPDVT